MRRRQGMESCMVTCLAARAFRNFRAVYVSRSCRMKSTPHLRGNSETKGTAHRCHALGVKSQRDSIPSQAARRTQPVPQRIPSVSLRVHKSDQQPGIKEYDTPPQAGGERKSCRAPEPSASP